MDMLKEIEIINNLASVFDVPSGRGLIVTEYIYSGISFFDGIKAALDESKNKNLIKRAVKRPCPLIHFNNGFVLNFRGGQLDGQSIRGCYSTVFAMAENRLPTLANMEFLQTVRDGCAYGLFLRPKDLDFYQWGYRLMLRAMLLTLKRRDLSEKH